MKIVLFTAAWITTSFSCHGNNNDTTTNDQHFVDSLNAYFVTDSTEKGYNWYLESVGYCLEVANQKDTFIKLMKDAFIEEKAGLIFKIDSLVANFEVWEMKSSNDAEKIYQIYRTHLSFCNNKKRFIAMFLKKNFILFTIPNESGDSDLYDGLNKRLSFFCKPVRTA